MTGSRPVWRLLATATVLAVAAWAMGAAAQAEEVFPSQLREVRWAPSRDEAVLVAAPESGDSHLARHPAGLSPSLLARRPQRLSRPFPTASEWETSAPVPAPETLPLPTDASVMEEGSFVEEGLPVLEGAMVDGVPGFDRAPCEGHCPPDCCGQWNSCGPVPIWCLLPHIPHDNLEFFGGVQGFTGPTNRGGSGSFGFHEGFNWGFPACYGCRAWQWGVRGTHSNFDGNYLTITSRNQVFVTGGSFRRVDWGLQGGLVVDYLHDEWDYEVDLLQLRGELSWKFRCGHEAGVWFTAAGKESQEVEVLLPRSQGTGSLVATPTTARIEVNEILAFFYRKQLACGGEGRLFGGFTTHSQGLVGGDFLLPIHPNWSLQAGFLYAAPDDQRTIQQPDFAEETWNVGLSLVWTPCGRSLGSSNYCRPLFSVADNGSFLTRLR